MTTAARKGGAQRRAWLTAAEVDAIIALADALRVRAGTLLTAWTAHKDDTRATA